MKVEKLDYYGRGVTHIDNKVCFVNNALPNEDIDINIINDHKTYIEANLKEIIDKSNEFRVKPKCKYYDICGGCQLMHIEEDKQEEFKLNKVKEIIKYKCDIDSNINKINYDKFYNYRNKIVLHVKDNRLGLYKDKTNELVEIDECLIVNKKINELITFLKEYIINKDINDITIRIGNSTNEVLLSINGNVDNYNDLLEKVDVLVINTETATDKEYINSIIGDKKYIVSLNSFFQVNEIITKKLYDKVYETIKELNSKNVLDLYCGTGTIGIYIADLVNKVIGIEVVESAIENANINKEINGVNNIEFINGKVEDKLDLINDNIDTIIVDPPRSGLSKKVVETIKKINPKSIIYISCNPLTLANNINDLKDNYNSTIIGIYDMFPNTYHVESITVLERR